MIYYWSPDYYTPVGGVKILYRHVDILNAHGSEASILHRHRGFRCAWFENNTRIAYIGNTDLTAGDHLVIPETYGSLFANPFHRPKATRIFNKLFSSPAKKVIFNQNTYNTFNGHSFAMHDFRVLYNHQDVIATLVVSDDNREYLRYTFPGLPIFRIHNSICPNLFSFQADKQPQICFMPRKNADHALQVINLLKFRGELNAYKLVPIEGLSEKQTAQLLQESLLFLSFGYPEGFSLPPAEAMSCGCIVAGYHGMGGREYFKSDFCFPVEMGDIVGFARTIVSILGIHKEQPEKLAGMAREASTFIRQTYSVEREREDILTCWRAITRYPGVSAKGN